MDRKPYKGRTGNLLGIRPKFSREREGHRRGGRRGDEKESRPLERGMLPFICLTERMSDKNL